MVDNPNVVEANIQELRRGTVVLACLIVLRTADYGYALLERLDELGLPVDANTLYPLLRRLEKQGLLTSDWNTDEARPRKFYRTTKEGDDLAALLISDWNSIQSSIKKLDKAAPTKHKPGGTR